MIQWLWTVPVAHRPSGAIITSIPRSEIGSICAVCQPASARNAPEGGGQMICFSLTAVLGVVGLPRRGAPGRSEHLVLRWSVR